MMKISVIQIYRYFNFIDILIKYLKIYVEIGKKLKN